MNICLIRHSITEGNLQHRYIGKKTDIPLCPEGIALAKEQALKVKKFNPDMLFVSPMIRCRETASILFPDKLQIIINELEECDFGDFEGKNFLELTNIKAYQDWIDSNGTLPFPNGESQYNFKQRCCKAIESIFEKYQFESAAIVAHGGTLMSILSEYEESNKSYFSWNIKNCEPVYCKVNCVSPLKLKVYNQQ
ncbi:MAG: histidine phosphatase family protein [Ruminococcus sp.]|nr:histidine phosphatase family protein [Ruminococcus sp.]